MVQEPEQLITDNITEPVALLLIAENMMDHDLAPTIKALSLLQCSPARAVFTASSYRNISHCLNGFII